MSLSAIYFLTELAIISSSLEFLSPFGLRHGAGSESLRHGPIGGWFDNYMLHTVSEKDSLTNNCSSSLANILVSVSLKKKKSYDLFADLYCIFQPFEVRCLEIGSRKMYKLKKVT